MRSASARGSHADDPESFWGREFLFLDGKACCDEASQPTREARVLPRHADWASALGRWGSCHIIVKIIGMVIVRGNYVEIATRRKRRLLHDRVAGATRSEKRPRPSSQWERASNEYSGCGAYVATACLGDVAVSSCATAGPAKVRKNRSTTIRVIDLTRTRSATAGESERGLQ